MDYYGPAPDNAFAGSAWGGDKVVWAVAPNVRSAVLVRGRELNGHDRVRFGLAVDPAKSLVLPAPRSHERRLKGGWRDFPTETRLKHGGCYAYQVDTRASSTVIVFKAL